MVDGGHGAERQHLAQREGHVRGLPHLLHRRRDQRGQALAAVIQRDRHGVPAVFAEGGEGRLDAVRRGHHAVLADAALLVAGLVQRRQHVAGEFAGFLEDRLDQIVRYFLVARQGGDAVEPADLPHGEKHVANRRFISGHHNLRRDSASGVQPMASAERACSRRMNFWILPVEVFGSGAEDEALGHLEPRQMRAAMLQELLLRRLGALAQFDEGARHLAPFLVRRRHDRRRQHVLVAVQHVLDLQRRDVLAARNDDVLRAVLDLDVAVGLDHREIAGAEPAAGEALLSSRARS